MSWLDTQIKLEGNGKTAKIKDPISNYQPTDLEKDRLMMIRQDFTDGDIVMKRPRRELNDLSMIERMAVDQMAFAVYQPNDGDALMGDEINGWRSNATRPIVRNKIISINAHVTARTIFPRVHAFNEEAQEEHDASTVMGDLMEWSVVGNNSAYADVSVQATTSALVNPISWVFTQYQEVYRPVKTKRREDGSWNVDWIPDEDNSGFIDETVPPDQVYFGEFYIRNGDVQLQPWLIRRKIMNFSTARRLFENWYPNFIHVKPGIQVIYNDANQQFYETYDVDLRQNEVEVVYYWNKSLDLYLISCNGILLTDADNPNPREDKLYPWATFGYELLRPQGDCMAYKSLAFKTMPDDKIVNTLYPMIIDASYLALFPPTIAIGSETIGSDVLIPGLTTTLSDPNADLKPILTANQNLKAAMDALFEVEKNIGDSSIDQQEAAKPENSQERTTAYQIAKDEQHAKILLGSFLHMVGRYVKQMGRLRIGDIKQYLTLPQLAAIEGSSEQQLIYKTFMMTEGRGRKKGRKIRFELNLPEGNISGEELLKHSFDTLREEGGFNSNFTLHRVNPILFRKLNYMLVVAPDVIAPLSDEYESQLRLEQYDRMIENPAYDQEEVARLLLEAYNFTRKHPDKYLAKQQPAVQGGMQPSQGGGFPQRPMTPGLSQLPQLVK